MEKIKLKSETEVKKKGESLSLCAIHVSSDIFSIALRFLIYSYSDFSTNPNHTLTELMQKTLRSIILNLVLSSFVFFKSIFLIIKEAVSLYKGNSIP